MIQEYLDFCDESTSLREAACMASEWHSGQWSALYMLSCYVYDKWSADDIDSMITEFEKIEGEDTFDQIKALETAKNLLERSE